MSSHHAPDAASSTASPLSDAATPLPSQDDNQRRMSLSPPPPPEIKLEGDDTDLAASDSLHPDPVHLADDVLETRKRKRAPSPPWTFPTAENTTLKAADGRRISARFNSSVTPALSETDDGGVRSSSLSAPRSRQPSPPWKRFAAEGPTSVLVDGKRKSGRVNKELNTPPPKRISPRTKKQADALSQTRKSTDAPPTKRSSGRLSLHEPSDTGPKKVGKPRRSSSHNADQITDLQAQIDALQPAPASHNRGRKRRHSPTAAEPTSTPQRSERLRRRSSPASPAAQRPTPTLKLRFTAARNAVQPPHPNAYPPSPPRPPRLTLSQRIEQLELRELQLPYTENERGPPDAAWFVQRAETQAREEGATRRRLLEEALPGGKLSRERLSLFQDADQQLEPAKQYGHHDHLVAHVLHLRHLQSREKTHHRNLAKKVAHEALEYWKAKRGPTEEDLREQEDRVFRLIFRQVVFDMRAKWDLVAGYVHQQRLQQWEAEEEIKRQRRLQEKLEWSENMVARQRGEADSDSEQEDVSSGDDDGSDTESDQDDSSEEENMSDSSSDDEKEDRKSDDAGEMDANELKAYLKQRELEAANDDEAAEEDESDEGPQSASLVDLLGPAQDSAAGDNTPMGEIIEDADVAEEAREQLAPAVLDGADLSTAALLRSTHSSKLSTGEEDDGLNLSSDESTDMDSEDYDSDEDMSSTDDEDDDEADDEEEGGEVQDSDEGRARVPSLLNFYSKNDIKTFGLPTPTTSAGGDERDRNVDPVAEDAVDLPNEQDVPAESVSAGEMMDVDHPDAELGAHAMVESGVLDAPAPTLLPATPTSDLEAHDGSAKQMVPSPTLLRGTLRSYQHAGLDWLASLYRNGTNGILADEMGLGKTIQTISLLAHLAEEHEIWETHLVIVPTSVILNWVTEFQKFLPGFRVLGYYGTAEERAAKRRGWVNDPHHEQRDKRGYNVVVTSYNVAMQDINAIRNVQWHYLVLDEAHNIRNFNSQRWQVLIRLKTRARLLLTGTPLQNSLTELWSLLTFLTAGDDDPAHGDLEEFLSNWKEPVKEIFDRGVQTLSNEAQRVVDQLHVSLRPFLLRRLKTEVEKDLPKKTESVVVCKLSKRQRQLYQDYMGLAETRRSLTQGNAVSAGRVLLSLRRVCNHPDLFDPRPIQTSFAMEKSPLARYAVREGLVRRLLGARGDRPVETFVVASEHRRKYVVSRSKALSVSSILRKLADEMEADLANTKPDPSTLAGCQALQKVRQREKQLERLRSSIRTTDDVRSPIYGSDLRELVTVHDDKLYKVTTSARPVVKALRAWPALGRFPLKFGQGDHKSDWLLSRTSTLQSSVQTFETYANRFQETIVKFSVCTPAVTSPILDFAIPQHTQELVRASQPYPIEEDWAHEARVRSSIAFPDSRLLIFDSGKLQQLTGLLRELQSRGSRSLIFTQMTGTLNILEQFLNLLNLPYLRLDGSTPVERRQLYSAEFNRPDSKYQCMILSSRAGGVGLNLTGASSVIFYDLDWNPQMDRQCMDRAHRIGQVRDVQVYKMVSEKTVEENILRRADQKSLLDQAVIQEGHFTTEYQQPARQRSDPDADDDEGSDVHDEDVAAAIDRFLGTGANEKSTTQAFESIEDREDAQAAQQARKEEQHQDEADFSERTSVRGPGGALLSVPPTPGLTPGPGGDEDDEGGAEDGQRPHVDSYMIRHMQRLLKDVPFVPPVKVRTGLDRKGRNRERDLRRKR